VTLVIAVLLALTAGVALSSEPIHDASSYFPHQP